MRRLFGSAAPAREPKLLPRYPDGQRMYCIGDIHGCAGLLDDLHRMIRSDAEGYEGAAQVLYLGDYIDRGRASSEVVDILLSQPLTGFEHVYLRGNHEQAILDFLEDPLALASWLSWGGLETLWSYGITASPYPSAQRLVELRNELEQCLPAAHRAFFEGLRSHFAAGSYYFVHAGVRPGVPLEKQELADQLWIREMFTRCADDFGAVIVHGHSITAAADFQHNRIGIDTGAFHTGVLTCLVLEGETRRLLQTGRGMS